jgi:hypothetical protein
MSKIACMGTVLGLAMGGCGATRLPPPAAPPRVLPSVQASGPPAPGRGRVILDVEGDRAVVEDVQGGSVAASGAGHFFGGSLEVSQRLCVTPCVVDLAPGPHTLRFSSVTDEDRSSDGYVNIDEGVSAYRERLGVHSHHQLKRGFGIASVVVGGMFVLSGAAAPDNGIDSRPRAEMLGVGAGLAILGWYLIHTSPSYDQEGSGVQWPVTPPVAGR